MSIPSITSITSLSREQEEQEKCMQFAESVLSKIFSAQQVQGYYTGINQDPEQRRRYFLLCNALAENLPSYWQDVTDIPLRDITLYARGLETFLCNIGYLTYDDKTHDVLLTAAIVKAHQTQVKEGIDHVLGTKLEHFSSYWSVAPEIFSIVPRSAKGKQGLVDKVCKVCGIKKKKISSGLSSAICAAFSPCDEVILRELLNNKNFTTQLKKQIVERTWLGKRIKNFQGAEGVQNKEILRHYVIDTLPYGTYPSPARMLPSCPSLDRIAAQLSRQEMTDSLEYTDIQAQQVFKQVPEYTLEGR